MSVTRIAILTQTDFCPPLENAFVAPGASSGAEGPRAYQGNHMKESFRMVRCICARLAYYV